MTRLLSLSALATLVALAAACGSTADTPKDGPPRPDAGLPPDAAPDAAPDAPPDAKPDAPPPIDIDHDGHPAEADCDDTDPDVWQDLPYSYRDADGDQHTVAETGTICTGASLPAGYATTPGEPDCNDADAAAHTIVAGFFDDDGDGVGAGSLATFCNDGVLPPGYVATDGDCATGDPARWINRSYSFRDADGDGAAVVETGMVCSGAALPPGYLETAPAGRPLDCDDANPDVAIAITIFADGDRDGIGAGPSQVACTNGSPPPGFSTTGTDCDDLDAAVWVSLLFVAVDFDEDGFTTPSMGMRCTAGVLLPPYYAAAHGNDCNDNDGTRWALLTYHGIDADRDGVTVPATGQLCTDGTLPPPHTASENGHDCNDNDATLTHFSVLYPDHDEDGVGAPPRQILCLGATNPDGLVPGGYDEDDADPAVIETDDFDELLDLVLN